MLDKVTGVLRSIVGAGPGVRFTPTLAFVRDTVPDAAHQTPAGEADPYREIAPSSADFPDREES